MKNDRKYGLLTATAMVVGSVIGSGVFFKTESLIYVTGGNTKEVLIAWTVGGIGMLLCLLSFVYVVRYLKSENGLTEIAKKTVGKRYAYYSGWFMATVYYPALTGVLSWLSARYTLLFLGIEDFEGGLCMLLSCLFLIFSFMQNTFFPTLSGKTQVVTTFVKMIPLVLMIVFGIANGMSTGVLPANMSYSPSKSNSGVFLLPAISAVMFAYEGWIAALSIGSELKNSKKNLPLALMLGGGVVAAVYILYYIGIMGSISVNILAGFGNSGIKSAFGSVFGEYASGLLVVFVAISCLGALNGMTFSAGRAMYVISKEENGPAPGLFSQLNPVSGTPTASFLIALVFSVMWLFFFFGFSISGKPLFGGFGFDVSEIPVITVYVMYIPMFIMFLKRVGRTLPLKVRILVVCGIVSCAAISLCAFFAHVKDVVDYALVLAGIMLFGSVFEKKGM